MLMNIINRWRVFCDQWRIYSLNITIMAAVLLIIVFLGATSFLYMHAPSTIADTKELEEYINQENANREWKRLYKYHGYPRVVIYEEGKTPYFYDKQGSKCEFVYPSKGTQLIIHQTKDIEDKAVLTLNDKESFPHAGF
jgi:hypothetical protein